MLRGHTAPVNSAVYSPDGEWIATASDDRTVRVWNARTGQEQVQWRGTGAVKSVAFSRDGQELVSGGVDSVARIWRWQAPTEPDSQVDPCTRLTQKLSPAEWSQYHLEEAFGRYEPTCPDRPV